MKNAKTKLLVRTTLLAAIIIVMAFTPLGYIKTLGLSIVLVHIPVILGALWFGPVVGAVLGGVFGATSFAQCFGLEVFGTTLLSISPVGTFITCMFPRILFGFLAGVLANALCGRDRSKNTLWFVLTGVIATALHTTMFMTSLVLFFYNTEYIQSFVAYFGAANPFIFVLLFVGTNGLIEIALAGALTPAIGKPVLKYLNRAK